MTILDNNSELKAVMDLQFSAEILKPFVLTDIDKEMITALESVLQSDQWKEWIDSTDKSLPPPDFYNDRLQVMMEHMQVDEHGHTDEKGFFNQYKKEEGDKINQVKSQLAANGFGNNIILEYNYISNRASEDDHNYLWYVESFRKVTDKHIAKIKQYRNNHPGYKLIFFIQDTSTHYVQVPEENKGMKIKKGTQFLGSIHAWAADRALIENLIKADIDCVVWFTPYKESGNKDIQLPQIVIFDPKRITDIRDYDPALMVSQEE